MKYLKTFENKKPEKKVKYHKNGNIESIVYYIDGILHREDGPAFQSWYENGNNKQVCYFINLQYHREDGPAWIKWYDNDQTREEIYYIYDKVHREDGPAIQKWQENGKIEHETYYINGYSYKKEDWINKLKEINSPHYKEQKMLYDMEIYNL